MELKFVIPCVTNYDVDWLAVHKLDIVRTYVSASTKFNSSMVGYITVHRTQKILHIVMHVITV